MTLSVVDAIILAPVILPLGPEVDILPPMILPVADIIPVTYSPEVAHTTTFDVPPTLAVILPPELTTVTFEVPLLILATLVITPLKHAPLPNI